MIPFKYNGKYYDICMTGQIQVTLDDDLKLTVAS